MKQLEFNSNEIAVIIKGISDKIKSGDQETIGSLEKITDKGEIVPLIILNDPRSINLHNLVIKLLSDALKSSYYDLLPLDYSSLFFNKTKHIGYYLRHNLGYGDMKLIQKYGTVKELCHAVGVDDMQDGVAKHIVKGAVSVSANMLYSIMSKQIPKVADPEKNKISDVVKNARLPIAVLFTGINDIMYYLHANPYNLKQTYQNKPDMFKFAAERAEDPAVLDTIIHCHRENIEDLKALNPNTDIYVVGAYLFSRMEKEYEKPFKDFIEQYNVRLEKLCAETGATFIDSSILVKGKCNGHFQNFIGRKPPILITHQILEALTENLSNTEVQEKRQLPHCSSYEYDDEGLCGIAAEIKANIERLEKMLQEERDKAKIAGKDAEKEPIVRTLESKIAEVNRELDVLNQAIAAKGNEKPENPPKELAKR